MLIKVYFISMKFFMLLEVFNFLFKNISFNV